LPPPLNHVVRVTLELPDGKPPVEVQGIVLHRLLPGSAQPSGAGVQFTGADDAFRARLDAYLEGFEALSSWGYSICLPALVVTTARSASRSRSSGRHSPR